MSKTSNRPAVKIKLVADNVVIGSRVHRVGDTPLCDEERAVRLVDSGAATFAPGVALSGDGRALQAELAKARPKAKPGAVAPTVRVRCVGEDRTYATGPRGAMKAPCVVVVGARIMTPNDEADVPEDEAVAAMVRDPGSIVLADGEALSPRGLHVLEQNVAGRPIGYWPARRAV
jgi:hypothetical protein